MTFGRFQPPHKGHGSLIKQVHDVAKEWSADPFIFTSNSTDYSDDVDERMKKMEKGKTNRNPLSPEEKINWLRKLYPEYYDSIINKKTYDDIRGWYKNITPYTVCYWLLDQGYTRIILVVGEDRVKSFENLKEEIEYLGHKAVLLFKERNEGAISGTKVRQMAVDGKFEEFKEAVQTIDENGKEILKEGEIEVLMKLVARKTDSQDPRGARRLSRWEKMRAALPSIGTKKKGKKKDTTGGGRRRKKKTRKKRGDDENSNHSSTYTYNAYTDMSKRDREREEEELLTQSLMDFIEAESDIWESWFDDKKTRRKFEATVDYDQTKWGKLYMSESTRNPSSREGKLSRRRFRLPFPVFNEVIVPLGELFFRKKIHALCSG